MNGLPPQRPSWRWSRPRGRGATRSPSWWATTCWRATRCWPPPAPSALQSSSRTGQLPVVVPVNNVTFFMFLITVKINPIIIIIRSGNKFCVACQDVDCHETSKDDPALSEAAAERMVEEEAFSVNRQSAVMAEDPVIPVTSISTPPPGLIFCWFCFCTSELGKFSLEKKKKKCELSHFWSGPLPPP